VILFLDRISFSVNIWNSLKIIFADIKIHHTVFALPFAVMSAFLAAGGWPNGMVLFWIVVAMFGARNAAMAFNRLMDARFDGLNPRTLGRAIPAGKVSPVVYWFFLFVSSGLLVFASYMLNPLAFYLSPVALILVFFYSLTKRFTSYSHFWLGLAISAAPVGAWVAVRQEISLTSLLLGAAVVFWLAGFDVIYSCQDAVSDEKNDLYSIPRRFGVGQALKLAGIFHAIMIVFLLALWREPLLDWLYLVGVAGAALLLCYEHSLVKADDLSKVNVAFFNVNGCLSVILMILVITDCVWI